MKWAAAMLRQTILRNRNPRRGNIAFQKSSPTLRSMNRTHELGKVICGSLKFKCDFNWMNLGRSTMIYVGFSESRADATIPMGWACAALKKFAKKTYVEKVSVTSLKG